MDASERAHPDRPISEELRPFVDGDEAEALDRAAARLADARPSLPDESRGRLRAELATGESGPGAWEPRHPGRIAAALLAASLLLLALAVLGLAGGGPLAH